MPGNSLTDIETKIGLFDIQKNQNNDNTILMNELDVSGEVIATYLVTDLCHGKYKVVNERYEVVIDNGAPELVSINRYLLSPRLEGGSNAAKWAVRQLLRSK